MSTYFDRELKKKLDSMGISSTSSDTLIKDYSAQRDYRSFDTYRKTDLLSQKEQDYIDDLKFKSYIKEEQKRRETLGKISSVTQTTSNMQKIEDLLNQSQIEKVKASKLFDFAKSYFDEIKEEPTYHNLYDNYIDEVARSRASVTKEKPDVAREYAQQGRPFKRWLWERAIDEVARSDALEGVVDPMEFRRELIHKLPSGELKHIEQPKTEELSGFQQFAKSVAETVLPGAKPKPEQVPGVGTGQLELENKRVSGIEAVGKQFVGSLVGTMRSMFTAGTFTPEEQEQKKAEHRDAESLSGVEKWLANAMVKGAKNMAKSGSGRSLLKAAEAVDVAGQSARAEDYILSAGYNLEQVEQKLYSEADMENRAWYTKLFSQAINTLPTIGLVSATGGFGLTALAVSGVKTQSENITRRQQAGEDISAGAGIAYVMGNVAIDVLSHAAFSRLATPGVDSVGQSLTNAINGLSAKIFGSSARVVGTNAAQSALKMAGKELAKVIAEGGAINLTNYVLSGFLSKVTVDKERALMGLNKDELITITGMLSAFASGGLRGAMVGVGRYARQKQTLDALAKMSGRDAKDVTVGELWQLYLGTLKDAEGQGYTQDFAKASGRALQTVVDGQEVTDAGAKLVPVGKAAEPIKTEVVAAPQAATKLTQTAPAQVKAPQGLPQEQKQELIGNTIKDVGAAEEIVPTTKEIGPARPISTGATISSSITPTEYQDTKVAVLKTGDVIPSMDQNGIANPDYNMTYQPRDVNRRGSTEQINEIASNLNVKKMYEKETIQNGMPVVGANGMVIAGNHRVAALLKVKEQNPDKYEEYKQYARDHAQELGLSADDLQGDFIVTRMLPEGTDLQQVADQSNIAEQRAMSPPELAKRDAGLLTDNVIDLFVGREDGSLMTAENQSFREAFISEVLGGNTDGVMDDKGNWSVQGLERLSNAILYKAYGSTRIATLATETLDHNFKRIVTALRNVAPQVIKFRDMVAKGQAHDIDVAKLIIDSTEKWIDLKQSGQNLDMYVRNVEIDETPESIRAKEMLRLIDKNKGSHQRLTRLFNDIIGTAVDAGHPQQLSMFDDGPITIDEILEIANRRDENDTITETTGAEVPTQVSGERSSGDGAKVEQKGPAEIQTESKQKANKQVKVSDKGYAEAVGEVSARQDTSGRVGIVAPGFASTQTQPPAQPQKISNYQGPKNDAVRKTFEESKRPPKGQKPSKIEKTMDFIRKTFFRASVPEVGFDEGQVRSNVVRLRKKYDIASQLAYESIKGIYNPIDGDYKTAMDYAVFLPDMIEDINNGLYKDASELPFPFDSFQEVYDEYDRLQVLINDPSDPTIKNALEARQKIFDANRKAILDLGNKLGIDFSGFFTRNDYVHHAIIDFMVQGESDPKARGGVNSILRARDGSVRAYITDAAMADYIALQKMADMTHKLEVLVDIKDRDITDKLQKDSAGNLIIPDGYREVDSTIVGFTFPAEMLKNQAVAVAKLAIDVAGIDPDSDVAMRILAEAEKTQRNAHYVIPSDVADAYDSLNAPKSVGGAIGAIDKVYGKAMGTWKRYQLVHPRRAFRFTLRNAISDTAKVFGFEPKVLTKHTVNAVRDLTRYYKGQGASENLIEYIKAGGLSSGLVNIELGDTKDLDKLNIYNKDGTMKTGDQLKEMMGTPLNVLEKFYDWREQILRYAGFTYYMDKGLDPVTNQPVNGEYRGSKPEMIRSMKNRRDIAYKMSNDIVGPYDDVSPFTQFLSKRVSPFIRYHATTNTAYFRGLKNSFYQDPDVIMSAGQKAARAAKGTGKAAASTVWRLGKFVLAMTAWTAAQQIWNRGIMKEADDNVPDYARNSGHITLGMWNGKAYYVSDTDPLRTALDWVGLGPQTAKDVGDVLSGRITPGALIKHILTAPYEELTESVAPFITPIFETKLGKKMFTGQYIRDPVEYVAELFQAGPMYRALAGKPQKDGKFDWNIMSFQKAYEGESQFWEIYTLMNKYLVSVGKPETDAYPPSKEAKHMALYEFRTAIRYRDQVAAEKYLIQYFLAGGDIKGIETSAKSMNPIQSLKKDDREPFIKSLTGHDKEMYDKGMEFYRWYADDMVKFAKYNQKKAQQAAAALAAEEAAKKNKRR